MASRKNQYSDEFKEQALAKVYSRGKRTIQAIADESNLSIHTLKTWMSNTAPTATSKPHPAKRPQEWRPEERLLALQESHGLSGEALHAWCRQHGLFAHQLAQWQSDFCTVPNARSGGDDGQTLRALKTENQRLELVGCGKQRAPHRSRLVWFVNSPHPTPAIGWIVAIDILSAFGQT